METCLITLHEVHIGEQDIPLVISQLEAEARDLLGLIGLPFPNKKGKSTDLDEEGLDHEEEKGEEVDPDSSAPSVTTNTDPNGPSTSVSLNSGHIPVPNSYP